jgi:hypothetical protein
MHMKSIISTVPMEVMERLPFSMTPTLGGTPTQEWGNK